MTTIDNNHDNNNDADDDSLDGAIARNMFRTDDDSTDEEEEEQQATTSLGEKVEPTFVQYNIMNILLEEQRFGASIAQRLWPAAEYLARYIMDNNNSYHSSTTTSDNNNNADVAQSSSQLCIIELGAGLGLTGLQLATHIPSCRVLLTDLPEAMPLLERNIALNRTKFLNQNTNAVTAQVLQWGNADDVEAALQWVRGGNDDEHQEQQLLVIAADCVYYKELHDPLEQTLSQLLSSVIPSSSCLLAGMRRWKRDNHFYNTLGQRTKTATHELQCNCLQETVSRSEEGGGREVIRVFGIEWKAKTTK